MRDKHGTFQFTRSGWQVSAITADCVAWLSLDHCKYHTEIVGLAQKSVNQVTTRSTTSYSFLPHHAVNPIVKC